MSDITVVLPAIKADVFHIPNVHNRYLLHQLLIDIIPQIPSGKR